MKTPTLAVLAVLALLPARAFAQAGGGNPADTDFDGLTDVAEAVLGTDPADGDTDDDGLPDGAEATVHFTAPLDFDTDNDGLSDGEEIAARTEPLDADTDDDRLPDGLEFSAGADPHICDTDADGLCDGDELDADTDPVESDTDGDRLLDGTETSAGTGPLVTDTDGDGLHDGTEVCYTAFDPLETDSDGDGISDQGALAALSSPSMLLAAGGSSVFQFTAQPFVSYEVLTTEDLITWTTLAEFPASPQPQMHSAAASTPAVRKFFTLKPH